MNDPVINQDNISVLIHDGMGQDIDILPLWHECSGLEFEKGLLWPTAQSSVVPLKSQDFAIPARGCDLLQGTHYIILPKYL